MSTHLGAQLTDALQSRLSGSSAGEYDDRAIVLCSVDEHGKPHPAMLSTRELFAIDASHLSLSTHAASRTAANLRANGHATVILADADGVFYIKGSAEPIAADDLRPGAALFRIHVTELLEDSPAAGEPARIVTGIRFDRSAEPGADS